MIRAQIISLGYERRSIDELVGILTSYRVKKLLDIREAPVSRRKGFSKNALSSYLEEFGIKYQHLRLAGNPHRKEKVDIQRCLRLYASYLSDNPEVIKLVAAELSEKSLAVLCYERQHENCHRSVLLEKLRQRGYLIKVVRVE